LLHSRARLAADAEALRKTISDLDAEAVSLGLEPNPESVSKEMDAVAAKGKTLQEALSLLEAYLEQSQISEIERQKQLAENEAEAFAKRTEQLQLIARNAKIATDTIKRVSWEAVDDCMSALSPLLSELYFRLRPHADYADIKYRMRGDIKRFLSFTVGQDLNPRFIFSSGQRRALGLSFLLAVFLSRPWCRLKSLILDDPVQHIDDYRALHFVEVFSSIRQLGYQVICFAEDPDLAELLCRRLRSGQRGEGLKVELEYESGEGATVRRVTDAPVLPQNLLLTA
jgi:chromosome segregation protein